MLHIKNPYAAAAGRIFLYIGAIYIVLTVISLFLFTEITSTGKLFGCQITYREAFDPSVGVATLICDTTSEKYMFYAVGATGGVWQSIFFSDVHIWQNYLTREGMRGKFYSAVLSANVIFAFLGAAFFVRQARIFVTSKKLKEVSEKSNAAH